MPCTRPLQGWLGRDKTKNGKRPLVFARSAGYADQARLAPCGVCVGCRASKASGWATRARLELETTSPAYFLTMTYSDDKLPGASLVPEHLKDFWKRVRKSSKCRYLACGEYGSDNNRPHYHAITFGLEFNDLVVWDSRLKVSKWLDEKWTHGACFIGEATSQSAAYVAGYTAKKLAVEKYPEGVYPPFLRVSTKPALGSTWALAHATELLRDALPIAPGRTAPVPKHILTLLEESHPAIYRSIKALRRARASAIESNGNRPSHISLEAILEQRVHSRNL